MKHILLITKAYLAGASFLAKGNVQEYRREGRLYLYILGLLGLFAGAIGMGTFLVMNYQALYQLGQEFGYPDLILLSALVASWVLSLVLSFTSGISVLYRSKDIRLLRQLPLRNYEIAASRISIVYLYMLPLHLLLMVPAIIIFASQSGWSLQLVIHSLIIIAVGNLAPIMISVYAASLLIRLAGFSRHHVAFEVAGMLVILAAVFSLQLLLSRMEASPETREQLMMFLSQRIEQLYSRLQPLVWGIRSISRNSIFDLLRFLLFSASVSGVLAYSLQRRYKIQEEKAASKKAVSTLSDGRIDLTQEKCRKRSIRRTLFLREWEIITSNSTFIMESFGQIIIFPIILLLGYVSFRFSGMENEVSQYVKVIEDIHGLELIVFGAFMIFFVLGSVPATSISREGESFRISRILPVSSGMQLQAKLLLILVFFYPTFVLYILGAVILLGIDAFHLVYMLPGGLAALLSTAVTGLLIDVKRPLLHWTHPQQAMKQNMNVLISMGCNLLLFAAAGGFAVLLLFLHAPVWITGFLIMLLFIMYLMFMFPRLMRSGERLYGAGA
ncbi:MAG: hypothetical protein K9L75_06355 [Spirochaetia bacterium]|nr:hypothetical protein [Spirochaetia bacterium]